MANAGDIYRPHYYLQGSEKTVKQRLTLYFRGSVTKVRFFGS